MPSMPSRMLAIGAAMFFTSAVQPQEPIPGVEEIVAKANHVAYYQGKDGRARVTMTITDAKGGTRSRELIMLRRDQEADGEQEVDGDQKFFAYFEKPADLNRMVYLVWKHVAPDKDDDRWLYQPDLDNVKRIAAGDKRTSFVGSHFFYEDVSGRALTEDVHELVQTNDTYYVLKNTPKDPKSVEFSYFEMWIHRATFLPVQTIYYDKQGQKYRQYTAEKVERIQGYLTVTKATMSDLTDGSKTTTEYSEVKYDLGLPDEIFSERYLRRAPTRYLQP